MRRRRFVRRRASYVLGSIPLVVSNYPDDCDRGSDELNRQFLHLSRAASQHSSDGAPSDRHMSVEDIEDHGVMQTLVMQPQVSVHVEVLTNISEGTPEVRQSAACDVGIDDLLVQKVESDFVIDDYFGIPYAAPENIIGDRGSRTRKAKSLFLAVKSLASALFGTGSD